MKKKFIQSLVDAFRPASLRTAEKEREAELARLAAKDARLEKQRQKDRNLVRDHLDPFVNALLSLPAEGGKQFYMTVAPSPNSFVNLISYGVSNGEGVRDNRHFNLGSFRKTVFGNISFEQLSGEEMSQNEMARKFALWVREVAPARVDEVENALAQARNPQRPRFSPGP